MQLRDVREFRLMAEQLQYLLAHVWDCDRDADECPVCRRCAAVLERSSKPLLQAWSVNVFPPRRR